VLVIIIESIIMTSVTITSILTEATTSAPAQRSCVSKLQKLIQPATDDGATMVESLCRDGIDRVLLVAKNDSSVERVMSTLCAYFTTTSESVFAIGVTHLLKRSAAIDKNIRLRAVTMIASWLTAMTSNEFICEETIVAIEKCLLTRLKDKIAAVRVAAIDALKSIQSAEASGESLRDEFIRLMSTDPMKDVRVAATDAVIACKETLPEIAARVRDVEAVVRVSALNRLHNSVRHLNSQTRASIVRQSLHDRDATVRAAAVRMLLKWAESQRYDIPKLLRLIGLNEDNTLTTAELVARTLCSEMLNNPQLGNTFGSLYDNAIDWTSINKKGFGVNDSALLLWTNVRCALAAESFTLTQKMELFEALLPDLAQLCIVIESNVTNKLASGDDLNINDTLCLSQLFGLVILMDDADTIGCQNMADLCVKLLTNTDFPNSIVAPVLTAYVSVLTLNGNNCEDKMSKLISMGVQLMKAENVEVCESMDEEERYCRVFRGLQIISWTLQQNIGGLQATDLSMSNPFQVVLASLVPKILESISSPSIELRSLAFHAIGHLGLVSRTIFQEQIQDLLFQASATSIEDSAIRSTAMKALADAVIIGHCGEKELVVSLLQKCLNESNSSADIKITATTMAAKLLFTNAISSTTSPNQSTSDSSSVAAGVSGSVLVPYVLTPFLIPDTLTVYAQNSESDCTEAVNALNQQLAVFAQTYFVSTERKQLLLDVCPELISSIVVSIRDEAVGVDAFARLHSQLLLLYNKGTDTASSSATEHTVSFQRMMSACICKEMLKLGNSKIDKAILKTLLQMFVDQCLDQWMDNDSVLFA
jgi:HEAT repeat protein